MNNLNIINMNTKLFTRLCLMLCMSLTIFACSNDESNVLKSENTIEPDEAGIYHYQVNLNCEVPTYDDANTRSVVYTWDNGANIIVRFKSGSKFVVGLATYNSSDGQWSVGTNEALPVINSEGTCELYYFKDADGMNEANVAMSEKTACYYTTNATYLHPSDNSTTINASLGRKTWRLRFKGASGTQITLPGKNNDVKYFSAFDGLKGSFTDSQKDLELNVNSDGYTPYVYGTFVNGSGENTITVVCNNMGFSKKLKATNLSVGESAFLTIPTEASHDGWEVLPPKEDDKNADPNATIEADNLITFNDGIVTGFTIGSTVETFDYIVMTKSGAEEFSDEELANEIYDTNHYDKSDADYIFKSTNDEFYQANTEYYLCAVAKNSSGQRGPVLRHLFKTKSESLPLAEISNVNAESNKWAFHIALKNNAKSYYLATSTKEENYNSDWHWYAYNAYFWATSGQLESYTWEDVTFTPSSGTCNVVTVCTWAIDANNNIGNCHVVNGNASSSARSRNSVHSVPDKEMLSKESMKKMFENTKIYRVIK